MKTVVSMAEVLLTSSVLILAMLVLRQAFRQKISRRVQYALWGLVLLRLLAPVSLPALDFSVLSVAEPVQTSISTRLEAPAFTGPALPVTTPRPQNTAPTTTEPVIPDTTPASASLEQTEASNTAKKPTLTEILGTVWLTGVVVMAAWLVTSNLRFAAMLRERRNRIEIPGCSRRVYMVESGLATPCLFGILRPAIYLTPAAVTNETSLRHVLAHEETHARHLDPLWALLRGVCLAIYWFDPLVWAAASAAKTDCELACDEGAIRHLGEDERLAYGKTLLSLIPVRRLPGNPLLSATTMSSDKKRLRDRISRIAERHKTRKLALCAVAVLTAGICLVTFAGCAEGNGTKIKPLASLVSKQNGPISAAELRYFNEQYFNGNYMNLRNQFLSSIYEDPADIDLFELLYCGAGQNEPMTDEEQAVYGSDMTDTIKISTAAINALLTEYTGLTLDETKRVNLDHFTYSPEYDAYYHTHGDTNYWSGITFFAGIREGDLIHLYYGDSMTDGNCTCVTLRDRKDGGYQFVSNTFDERPIVPTVYPETEPLASISLKDLTPFAPERVEVTHHSGDCDERFIYQGNWILPGGEHIQSYLSTDGNIYAAQVIESSVSNGEMVTWEADCFATMRDVDFSINPYSGLFGRNGFTVCDEYYKTFTYTMTDYYYFETDGSLWHLAQVRGSDQTAQITDLDGDGNNELLVMDGSNDAELLFERDGKYYRADIDALLREAFPDEIITFFSRFDPYARCLMVQTTAHVTREDGTQFVANPFHSIYFDGENLQVYKQDKSAVDHVSTGVIGPEEVLDVARQIIQEEVNQRVQAQYLPAMSIDDWRITALGGPFYDLFDSGTNVMVYGFAYELHSAAPEQIPVAGDMYMNEDGWFNSGETSYIGFILDEDGKIKANFYKPGFNTEPYADSFHEDVEAVLREAGLIELTPAQDVQRIYDWIKKSDEIVLELRQPGMDAKRYTVSPDGWYAPDRLDNPADYTWTKIGEYPPAADFSPNTEELTVASPNGDFSLTFYSTSDRVLCQEGDSKWWCWAENMTDPEDVFYNEYSIFNFMRRWFDEEELSALRTTIPAIPDDGRSHEEIAQIWAETYEGLYLNVSSGSHYKWSYMDIRDVDLDGWGNIDVTRYAKSHSVQEVFLFNFSAVFVPENDPHGYFMAGNTTEYEGSDAPEGAFQWWRCGYMYLTEDGWRCDEVGTGP